MAKKVGNVGSRREAADSFVVNHTSLGNLTFGGILDTNLTDLV